MIHNRPFLKIGFAQQPELLTRQCPFTPCKMLSTLGKVSCCSVLPPWHLWFVCEKCWTFYVCAIKEEITVAKKKKKKLCVYVQNMMCVCAG